MVADNVTIGPEFDRQLFNRLMDGNHVSAACHWEAKGARQAPKEFETITEVWNIAHATRRIALRTFHRTRQVIQKQGSCCGCLLFYVLFFLRCVACR